jgi:hypothetical protein
MHFYGDQKSVSPTFIHVQVKPSKVTNPSMERKFPQRVLM